MKRLSILATLLIMIMIAESCSTTKVISSWSLNNPPDGAMEKVLVLGVMRNRENRDVIEQTMVNELGKSGIVSSTATGVFGPKGFQGLTEEEITGKLKGSEFTSVMIVAILDKERENDYTPGSRYATPRVVGYNRYYRRYLVVYDYMYTPGYYTTSTNYILEADIYSVNDDELIYSAQTRSYDPNSSKDLAESFTKSIITELKEKGIVPSTK